MIIPSSDYILNVLAPVREFRSRVTITFPLQGTTKVYDDNSVVKMNILEQKDILSDSLPSNELTLTIDNTNGDFDLLNFSNMQQIIGSKPKIVTELGLVLERERTTFEGFRYLRDWINGNNVNTTNYWNEIKVLDANGTNIAQGKAVTTNGTMTNGVNITDGNTTNYGYAWGQTGGVYAQIDLGSVRTDIKSFNITHYYADGRTFYDHKVEVSEDGVNWTTIYDTNITGDKVETANGLTILPSGMEEYVEFIPTGSFFLTSWQNDMTNKIITLIGNDYLALLSDISFEPTASTVLSGIALDVLMAGGVPPSDIVIDSSLDTITVNPFPERLDCRTALQHIGIASQCAVYQDRYGKINIKPFKTLGQSPNFTTYTTVQNSLYSIASPNSYNFTTTGSGMKRIDFDAMYNHPTIELQPSIYHLIIVQYDANGNALYEHSYFNTELYDNRGESFKIENPLVNSLAMADKIASFYMSETNYNAHYRVNWRQNPILESADIIFIEDSFGAEKQSRIIKQELIYQGYLMGNLESRGGI